MKCWPALLMLLLVVAKAEALTCATLFADPLQGNGSGSNLNLYDSAKVTSSDGQFRFVSQNPTPYAVASCPSGGDANRRCTITGSGGPTYSKTVLASSSSTNINQSGGSITLGSGGYNQEQFGTIRLDNNASGSFSSSRTVYRTKQIELFTGSTLTLAPGDYWITGSIQIDRGSKIALSGTGLVRMFVNGNINVTASGTPSHINQWGTTQNLLLYTTGSLTVSDGGSFNGAAYVTTNANFNSNSTFTGALSARWPQFSNTTQVFGVDLTAVDYGDFCISYEFALSYGANALTCKGHPVTLNVTQGGAAYNNFSGTVRVSTSTGRGTWSISSGGGSINNLGSGQADYTFPATNTGSVTLLLDNTRAESLTITAADALATTTGSTVTFRAKGYSATTVAAGVQRANKPFTLRLTAISDDPVRAGCEVVTDYAGSKTLALWATRDLPVVNAGTAIEMGGGAVGNSSGTATNRSVTFTAGVGDINVRYADAGQITLYARDDTGIGAPPADTASEIIAGSGTVIVNPQAIVVEQIRRPNDSANPAGSAATAATGPSVGSGFVAAGSAFKARLRAVTWQVDGDADYSDNSTAPSFAAAVTVTPSLHSPAAGSVGNLRSASGVANGSSVDLPSTVFSSGIAALSNWRYHQYGSFRFGGQASNYLQAGNHVSISTSGVVGRFYPHHLALTEGSVTAGNGTNTGCVAAFQYMDDAALRVVAEVRARGEDNAILSNYQADWGTLASLVWSAENSNSGTNLGSRLSGLGASWSAGAYRVDTTTAQFAKRADSERDGPYASLQLALTASGDSDGANFNTLDAAPVSAVDCVAAANCTAKAVGTVAMRYGRLNGRNAYGSELQPLALPLWLEYWNGSRFAVASDDSCSQVLPARLNANGQGAGNLTAIPLVGTGSTDLTLRQPVVAGQLGVSLSAPGQNNTGYLLLVVDSSSALQFLRDRYDGTSLQGLPQLHAAFGYHRGNDRLIYREPR